MCDDIQAINYNDTTTDPVCKYESDVVIWLDVTATQYFDSLGIPLLSVNAGNEVAGSMPTNAAFPGIVLCTDTNPEPIHYIYQWENEQMTTVTLTVSNTASDIMFESIEDVLSDGCTRLQLTRDKIEAWQDSQ